MKHNRCYGIGVLVCCIAANGLLIGGEIKTEDIETVEVGYSSGHFRDSKYLITTEKLQWVLGGQYNTRDEYKCAINKTIFRKVVSKLKDTGALQISEEESKKWAEEEKKGQHIPTYTIVLTAAQKKVTVRVPYSETLARYKGFDVLLKEIQTLCVYLSEE